MAETKRKTRDDGGRRQLSGGSKKPKTNKKGKGAADKAERKGPRLPNALRKELERLNPRTADSDEELPSDEEALAQDLYEYEEGRPEEESKKNRRFDPVDNLDYELPEDFEDEDVLSDDDNEVKREAADEAKEENDGRRIRETPSETTEGRKRKMNNFVVSEAYPESEYNPTRDVLDGEGVLSIGDLLDPLQGKHGYSKLRKRVQVLDKKSAPIQAPLPKHEKERVERKVTYEISKEELRKWEPIVKRNREAPTIYFDADRDLGPSSVGTIASEFEPRTEFEKKMASLYTDDEVVDAHRKDGSRLLELNKVSAEDEKERQNRIAKMRSLLFRHELKSKHIKNIKSKTYHRMLKKDKLKANSLQSETDPEASKELAMKQEYERAKERATLKHKGNSKFAKRIKERGLAAQDDGTRAAIAEQQHLHAQLTRKMKTMKDSDTSSDDVSDDDDTDVSSDDEGRASKLIEKAKEKTLKLLNEDNEVPNSGVLSLPFMERASKKKKEAADEEAKLALQEYESWQNQLGDSGGVKSPKVGHSSGRMVFNGKEAPESSKKIESDNKIRSDNYYGDSDSEDDLEPISISTVGKYKSKELMKGANASPVLLHEDSENHTDPSFKNLVVGVQDPGPQATHEVSIFASGTWRKMKNGSDANANVNAKKSSTSLQSAVRDPDVQQPLKDLDDNSDSDIEEQMTDGVIPPVPEPSYELPSQEELIRQAFAADNVEDEFKKTKEDILNEENPEPEKPVLLPGWGQWTNIQKKKGIPAYMQIEHESAKKKREEALKGRKDANLKHVIISEKPPNKKSQKLFTPSLPYPFTSKEVFEQSIRMPLGPEFNPASMVGALNRPDVIKKPGEIINPIEFEEVNAYEKIEGHKKSGQKQQKTNNKSKSKSKSKNNKNTTKMKTK